MLNKIKLGLEQAIETEQTYENLRALGALETIQRDYVLIKIEDLPDRTDKKFHYNGSYCTGFMRDKYNDEVTDIIHKAIKEHKEQTND